MKYLQNIQKCRNTKVQKYGHDNLNQKKCNQNHLEEGGILLIPLKSSNFVVTHFNMGMKP